MVTLIHNSGFGCFHGVFFSLDVAGLNYSPKNKWHLCGTPISEEAAKRLLCKNKVSEPICTHQYRKTEPSRLDKDGVLIWVCSQCGHEKSSM